MKKIFIYAAALAALASALVSCSKEEPENPNPPVDPINHFEAGQKVTLNGYTAATKVSSAVEGSNLVFKWEEGDAISITVGEESASFPLTDGAGTNAGQFTGIMPATGDTFDAQYPASEPDLSEQTYCANGLPEGKMVFKATGCKLSDEQINFANTNSFLCMYFTKAEGINLSVKSIVVTDTDSQKTYHLDCGESGVSLDHETSIPFFLVVPNESFKVKVEVFGTDGETDDKLVYYYKSNGSIDFTGGKAIKNTEISPRYFKLEFKKGEETITEDNWDLYQPESKTYESPVLSGFEEGATISYSSSDDNKATVMAGLTSGSMIVTPKAVGDPVIKATVSKEGYIDTEISYTLHITDSTPETQTIKFMRGETEYTTNNPDNIKMTEAAGYVMPSIVGALDLSKVTYTSNNESVAKFDDTKKIISVIGSGEAIITATSPAGTNPKTGKAVTEATAQYKLNVDKVGQTIKLLDKQGGTEVTTQTITMLEAGTYTLPYVDGAKTKVNFTTENTDGVVTINNTTNPSTITVNKAGGPITIKAKAEADATYAESNETSYTLTVNLVGQTIQLLTKQGGTKVTSQTITMLEAGTYTLPYVDGAKTKVNFTTGSTTDVVTINNTTNPSTITVNKAGGPITIKAKAEADNTYAASTEVSYTLTINLATKEIKFKRSGNVVTTDTFDLIEKDGSYSAPTIDGAEGRTVTYGSNNLNLAAINQKTGVVTINSNNYTGSAVITATAAANNIYAEATVTYTLTVSLTEHFRRLQENISKANGIYMFTNTDNNKAFQGKLSNDKTKFLENDSAIDVSLYSNTTNKIKYVDNTHKWCKVYITKSGTIKFIEENKYICVRTSLIGTTFAASDNSYTHTISLNNENFMVYYTAGGGGKYYLCYYETDNKFTTSYANTSEDVNIWEFISSTPAPPTVFVTQVSLNKTSESLNVGATLQLSATVKPDNASDKTCTWSSSNENVATVDETGLVTAKGKGEATITCSANGSEKGDVKATCKVTVNNVAVTGVTLNQTSAELNVGGDTKETLQLTATISPADATVKSCEWSTSNKDVATVSDSGLVTGVANAGNKEGEANITYTVTDANGNTKTATCSVKVDKYVTGITISPTTWKPTETGKTQSLTVTVTPADARVKTVSWKSSDEKVATVNNKGVVTCKGEGEATITCTLTQGCKTKDQDKIKATCSVDADFGGCVAAGTKITMADGSVKNVEQIVEGDLVRTFNHETGTISSSKVCYVFTTGVAAPKLTLKFASGKTLSIVISHDLIAKSSLKYVSISKKNVESYIGESFYCADDGKWDRLVNYSIDDPAIGYAVVSNGNVNCITGGFLSIPEELDFGLNIYELNENLKADQNQLAADIAKYGLSSVEKDYPEFIQYKDLFEAMRGPYIKIAVGKGIISEEEVYYRMKAYVVNYINR